MANSHEQLSNMHSEEPLFTRRTFKISPKTTVDIINTEGERGAFHIRGLVAGDIIQNAHELTPEIDWKATEIYFKQLNLVTKKPVIMEAATKFMNVAKITGWNMHTPEMVYMSGLYPKDVFGKKIAFLDDQIQQINNGTMEFTSNEDRLHRIDTEMTQLQTNISLINESLLAYARQFLKGDEKYMYILDKLMFLDKKLARRRGDFAILLKSGKVNEIYSQLTQSPET